MEPVVRGRDITRSRWSASSSEDTAGRRGRHLRRARLAIYLCAAVFCVASASLSAAALADCIDLARQNQTLDGNTHVYNKAFVGAGSYNIFAGVFVAFVFGAAFFTDLMLPERHDSPSARRA
ncbi:hypothetical protein B0A54_00216 [Friedmanniomyces endolithicus]|uniref:Uncharacterized protein n=1 Tax=Friedmanniomyces endolithicus TaxID=329885 RepID=A0A4V5NA66_9PEZI|nr:hypothetical protein B0A54_00216 [Friedmanniomyces endolithicus]